jgi:hypothetical protein
LPTIVYPGPLPQRRTRCGTLYRGQPVEITYAQLLLVQGQVTNGYLKLVGELIELPAVVDETVDAGNDGIPDEGWTRNDTVEWLNTREVRTRVGLTKAQLLTRVEEYINPVEEESSDDDNNEEPLTGDNTE